MLFRKEENSIGFGIFRGSSSCSCPKYEVTISYVILEELSGLHHESLSPQNGVCFQVTQPNFSLGSRSATQRNADLWFHLPGKSNLTPSGGHGCASADSPQALRLRDQREVFSCNDGFIGAQATYS
jgi:hypothetical protein